MFRPVRAVKPPSVMEGGLTLNEAGHTEVTAVPHDIGAVPRTGPASRAFLLPAQDGNRRHAA
ncbi:hypothetical protein ACLQ2R_03560 [Streptosporangium sp. DT93]|uniref:hypothetical protein n=1 Tax=Streptosporangium sp. DT93 TaxID=3393428 RepID=UPI003CF7B330